MCIRILNAQGETSYDMNRPLEEQVRGSRQIVVNYEPQDPALDKFLDEIERLCRRGISTSLNIKFNHNNFISGAKAKRKAGKLEKDLDINELIKLLATSHKEADQKMEEIINYCMGENRVKPKA